MTIYYWLILDIGLPEMKKTGVKCFHHLGIPSFEILKLYLVNHGLFGFLYENLGVRPIHLEYHQRWAWCLYFPVIVLPFNFLHCFLSPLLYCFKDIASRFLIWDYEKDAIIEACLGKCGQLITWNNVNWLLQISVPRHSDKKYTISCLSMQTVLH